MKYIQIIALFFVTVIAVTSAQITSTAGTASSSSLLDDAIATRSKGCKDLFEQGDSSVIIPEDKKCQQLSSPDALKFLVAEDKCSYKDLEYIVKEGCGMSIATTVTSATMSGSFFLADAIATRPKSCQDAFTLANTLSPTPEDKQCETLSSQLAKGFLIAADKCSDTDLEYVRNVACSMSIGTKVTSATISGSSFLDAISTRRKSCQDTFTLANSLSPTPVDKRCVAMSSQLAKGFFVAPNKCSGADFEYVRNVACGISITTEINSASTTPVPSTTNRQQAVMGLNPLSPQVNRLTTKCQNSFWGCLKVLPQVRSLVDQRFYCRAMRLHQANFCMVAMGDCREKDLDKLKAATCQGIPEDTLGDNSACMKNTSILTIILAFLAHLVF